MEPPGSIGYTKIHRSAVGTAYATLGFFPHVEGSALPVVLAIAAVGEKEWVRLGMKELSAPDTRVEVVHRLLLLLTLVGSTSGSPKLTDLQLGQKMWRGCLPHVWTILHPQWN